MSQVSITDLMELTGRSRPALKNRIQSLQHTMKGNAMMYDSQEALPLIYGQTPGGNYNLEQERARLAARQAEKVELDLANKREELIPFEVVEKLMSAVFMEVRAALLSQHNTVASQYPEVPADVIRGILSLNQGLLQSLAGTRLPGPLEAALAQLVEPDDPAPEPDGKPVGRRKGVSRHRNRKGDQVEDTGAAAGDP